MADGMFGDLGKVIDAAGVEIPGLGEAIAPSMHILTDSLKGFSDAVQGPVHDLIEGMVDSDLHVEMIDETTETPDGTIVAHVDPAAEHDTPSHAESESTHTDTEA